MVTAFVSVFVAAFQKPSSKNVAGCLFAAWVLILYNQSDNVWGLIEEVYHLLYVTE